MYLKLESTLADPASEACLDPVRTYHPDRTIFEAKSDFVQILSQKQKKKMLFQFLGVDATDTHIHLRTDHIYGERQSESHLGRRSVGQGRETVVWRST